MFHYKVPSPQRELNHTATIQLTDTEYPIPWGLGVSFPVLGRRRHLNGHQQLPRPRRELLHLSNQRPTRCQATLNSKPQWQPVTWQEKGTSFLGRSFFVGSTPNGKGKRLGKEDQLTWRRRMVVSKATKEIVNFTHRG